MPISAMSRSPHKIQLVAAKDQNKKDRISMNGNLKDLTTAVLDINHARTDDVFHDDLVEVLTATVPPPADISTPPPSAAVPSSKTSTAKSGKCSKKGPISKGQTKPPLQPKLTQFFPIRRSNRTPKNEVEAKQQKNIEQKLLCGSDEQLPLRVSQFPGKGRGVVATQSFTKGDFVVEYSGDLISIQAAKEREINYAVDVSKGCYMYYFKHLNKHYCIDATKDTGRLGRLVNHSRLKPNLQTKVVCVKDTPRLILVAKRDIDAGEELLYDYGDRSKESLQAHPWLAF